MHIFRRLAVSMMVAVALVASPMAGSASAGSPDPNPMPPPPPPGVCLIAKCAPKGAQDAMASFFNRITAIPTSVLLQGDAATQRWLDEHPEIAKGSGVRRVSAIVSTEGALAPAASVLSCVAAITGVIVTTAFPAAKLFKIAKLVKELGGGFKAARLIVGGATDAERSAALKETIKMLAAELSGVAAISVGCFS